MRAGRPYQRHAPASYGRPAAGWRARLHGIIFEADTPAGRRFDIGLVVLVLLSVVVVLFESVPSVRARHAVLMHALEWIFTLMFSVEYLLRLICVRRPLRYAGSFFGLVDLLSVLPTYISLLVPGGAVFLDIRVLRLLRVFRIFKLTLYIEEYSRLAQALTASRRKILVFLSVVLMAIVILGTVMYVVEGPANGYTSIPVAMYWATVTMTTVGYGDITPHTQLGKLIASFMMLLGWGILAVPTGIVTAEMTSQHLLRNAANARHTCPSCGTQGHSASARFCQDCGAALDADPVP